MSMVYMCAMLDYISVVARTMKYITMGISLKHVVEKNEYCLFRSNDQRIYMWQIGCACLFVILCITELTRSTFHHPASPIRQQIASVSSTCRSTN